MALRMAAVRVAPVEHDPEPDPLTPELLDLVDVESGAARAGVDLHAERVDAPLGQVEALDHADEGSAIVLLDAS